MSDQILQPVITDGHQLLQHLSDTIGADVVSAMDGVEWKYTESPPQVPVKDNPAPDPGNTQPQAPPNAANPAPAPNTAPAKAAQEIDFESLRDPKNGLLMGKYPSPTELFRGMHSLIHMTKEARAENDALLRQNQELSSRLSTPPPVLAPVNPVPGLDITPELAEVLARVKEDGMSDPEIAEHFARAVAREARRAAEDMVNSRSAAETQSQRDWSDVDSHMTANYPASLRFVDELGLFMESDPLTKAAVGALLSKNDRKSAMELAWRNYAGSIGMDPRTSTETLDPVLQEKDRLLRAQAEVRREEVDAARKDAGLLSTGASGVHETPGAVGPSQEEMDNAVRMMRQGYPEKWRALAFGNQLKGPFFE